MQNLKGAQTIQNNTNDAQKQVQGANADASAASATAAASPQAQKLTGGVTDTPNLDAAASAVAAVMAAAVLPEQPASAAAMAGAPPLNGTNKKDSLKGVLKSSAYNDLTRVTVLSAAALDDLPDPNFSTIAVNIQACWPAK